LPCELKASNTTSVNKDHSSTIKPVTLTKQPNQDAERHSYLNTKNYGAGGPFVPTLQASEAPLLPWGSQNMTRNILNFAAYFCVSFVSNNFLQLLSHAFAISS
jgi:hypothetical protein